MSNNYEVDILINDKPIRKFTHQSRVFVEARNSQEYGIRIKNNSHKRIMAVVSVDGINVINGLAAGSEKVGYIIQGYSSYTVPGFRKSNETTTAFKFNSKDKSYAALSDETQGDTTNCGIIGVQIYAEKEKPQPEVVWRTEYIEKPIFIPTPCPRPWREQPYKIWYGNKVGETIGDSTAHSLSLRGGTWDGSSQCYNMSMQGTSQSNLANSQIQMQASLTSLSQSLNNHAPGFDMGTEYSDKEVKDFVHEVEFETGRLVKTFEIYYASYNGLVGMGVPMTKEAQIAFPSAFPSRFCKPPRKS